MASRELCNGWHRDKLHTQCPRPSVKRPGNSANAWRSSEPIRGRLSGVALPRRGQAQRGSVRRWPDHFGGAVANTRGFRPAISGNCPGRLGGIRDQRQSSGADNRSVVASGTLIRCRPTALAEIGWLENPITIPTPPLDHTGVCIEGATLKDLETLIACVLHPRRWLV